MPAAVQLPRQLPVGRGRRQGLVPFIEMRCSLLPTSACRLSLAATRRSLARSPGHRAAGGCAGAGRRQRGVEAAPLPAHVSPATCHSPGQGRLGRGAVVRPRWGSLWPQRSDAIAHPCKGRQASPEGFKHTACPPPPKWLAAPWPSKACRRLALPVWIHDRGHVCRLRGERWECGRQDEGAELCRGGVCRCAPDHSRQLLRRRSGRWRC